MSKELDEARLRWEHAFGWFTQHANQRYDLIRLFLVVLTLFAAGLGAVYREFLTTEVHLVEFGYALLAGSWIMALASLVFHLIDLRNQELLEASIAAMKEVEADEKTPFVTVVAPTDRHMYRRTVSGIFAWFPLRPLVAHRATFRMMFLAASVLPPIVAAIAIADLGHSEFWMWAASIWAGPWIITSGWRYVKALRTEYKRNRKTAAVAPLKTPIEPQVTRATASE